jgi:iron complex transport system substrate-binding protein
LFRAWSGQSPIEYRNTLRLSQAEAMLRNTDMQIKEIAETVGFEDSFYFSRVFAQYFGVSPKKYRNGANFTASRAE